MTCYRLWDSRHRTLWWWCHFVSSFAALEEASAVFIPSRGWMRIECFSKLILSLGELSSFPSQWEEKGRCGTARGGWEDRCFGKINPALQIQGLRIATFSRAASMNWCVQETRSSQEHFRKGKEEIKEEMGDRLSVLRNKAEDTCVLKSFWNLYFSFQFSGKLIFVAPFYHEFSIHLLVWWTGGRDLRARGERNVALLDATEEKNIFAAVNRPTYFFKKYVFGFEQQKLL